MENTATSMTCPSVGKLKSDFWVKTEIKFALKIGVFPGEILIAYKHLITGNNQHTMKRNGEVGLAD